MRIRITLSPHHYPAAVPLNHFPLAAFIYETVASVAPELASYLHDEGLSPGGQEDKRFKFFVFSLPELPPYYFQGEQRWFEQGVMRWQISSPLPEFIEALVTGLGAQDRVRIGSTQFTVAGIEIMPAPRFTERMRFMALSPLTVATTTQAADGRRIKHYLRANEEEFGPLVVANLLEKYRALFGREPDHSCLSFSFDQDYIQRAGGVESKKVSRLIQYKGTRIKCYQVPFIVVGNPELIHLGWECGFGSANSQGFGMAGV